jgi:hypothetical protein
VEENQQKLPFNLYHTRTEVKLRVTKTNLKVCS